MGKHKGWVSKLWRSLGYLVVLHNRSCSGNFKGKLDTAGGYVTQCPSVGGIIGIQ